MAGGGSNGKGEDEPEGQATATKHERYALNVIPTEARAGFDVRIDPNTPTEHFKARLAGWCKEEGVTWELADWTTPLHDHYLTSVDREENPWWGVFLVMSWSMFSCFVCMCMCVCFRYPNYFLFCFASRRFDLIVLLCCSVFASTALKVLHL